MNELVNKSEIHNGSILLFPPRDKQEVSPSHPIAPFKSSSLICHKEQRREEICATKYLSDSVKEFKSLKLISLEERRFPRSFNDRASHINNTDKSNDNVPASCNHSSSETTAEQKINAPNNSSGNNANFPNPVMSVNKVYNFDAHAWPKNTILLAENSMINGINEKRICTNSKSVKVRCFSGGTTDDMYFNLILLLRKKTATLVLHVGNNNSSNETSFQIYDKLLNLVHFVKENNPNCHVVLSSPINGLGEGRAAVTIKRLNCFLSESSLGIIDNGNIGHSFLGMHGLYLNEHGVVKLGLDFF